jgi:hypothetical protein
MGVSFSRSVKFGPLRVNFSTRSVGLSAGVRGARVSVGPRGTYVSLGAGGFRYRAKVGGAQRVPATPSPSEAPATASPALAPSVDPGRIHTASVAELAESSPDSVLREIQDRVHRFDWFMAYAIAVGAVALSQLSSPGILFAGLIVAGVPGYFLYAWNRERKTARLIYDVDDQELLYRLSVCNAAGEALSKPTRLWHIYSSLATSDWKRNAGASALIRRTNTACRAGSLTGIELNIEPWCVAVGPQQFLFLPDRILVHERRRFAALPYESLVAQFEVTRFIEEAPVPNDARQVDTTWRFVNKSGGPDRRFNNNRQFPVMEYGRLTLTSSHGLTVIVESSNPSATLKAQQAIQHLREVALRSPEHGLVTPMAEPVQVTSPGSRTIPTSQSEATCLRSFAVVLRYIAAADRKLSEPELEFISHAIARFSTRSTDVQLIMDSFHSMRSDSAEARRAVLALVRDAPAIANSMPALVHELAGVDGRVTPKERERLAEVTSWLTSTLRNSA